MDLYNDILKENILNIKDLDEIYLDYFPSDLVAKYREDLYSHPLLQEIMTTQAINFFVNFLGIRSTLLLGINNKDRSKIFSEILNNLNSMGGYKLLNELALLRDKELEKDVINQFSIIRDNVFKKWNNQKTFDNNLQSKIYNKLSENSKFSFNKFLE
jgi:hypothetical protein